MGAPGTRLVNVQLPGYAMWRGERARRRRVRLCADREAMDLPMGILLCGMSRVPVERE